MKTAPTDRGTDLPAAVLIVKDPVADLRCQSPLIRFVWPVRCHVTMVVWPVTDLKRPAGFRAIEPGRIAFADTTTVSTQSATTSPFECRLRIISGASISHGRAVPVFGMLEVVLHRYLVASRSGLPGKFQVAGVLRHSALAAAPAAPTIDTTSTALR